MLNSGWYLIYCWTTRLRSAQSVEYQVDINLHVLRVTVHGWRQLFGWITWLTLVFLLNIRPVVILGWCQPYCLTSVLLLMNKRCIAELPGWRQLHASEELQPLFCSPAEQLCKNSILKTRFLPLSYITLLTFFCQLLASSTYYNVLNSVSLYRCTLFVSRTPSSER